MNQATLLALACVFGVVLTLGGGVLLMLYSVGELRVMLRSWLDRK
jgi:hypothetical protein